MCERVFVHFQLLTSPVPVRLKDKTLFKQVNQTNCFTRVEKLAKGEGEATPYQEKKILM